jgi:hypothetical protein
MPAQREEQPIVNCCGDDRVPPTIGPAAAPTSGCRGYDGSHAADPSPQPQQIPPCWASASVRHTPAAVRSRCVHRPSAHGTHGAQRPGPRTVTWRRRRSHASGSGSRTTMATTTPPASAMHSSRSAPLSSHVAAGKVSRSSTVRRPTPRTGRNSPGRAAKHSEAPVPATWVARRLLLRKDEEATREFQVAAASARPTEPDCRRPVKVHVADVADDAFALAVGRLGRPRLPVHLVHNEAAFTSDLQRSWTVYRHG